MENEYFGKVRESKANCKKLLEMYIPNHNRLQNINISTYGKLDDKSLIPHAVQVLSPRNEKEATNKRQAQLLVGAQRRCRKFKSTCGNLDNFINMYKPGKKYIHVGRVARRQGKREMHIIQI